MKIKKQRPPKLKIVPKAEKKKEVIINSQQQLTEYLFPPLANRDAKFASGKDRGATAAGEAFAEIVRNFGA